MGFLDKLLGKKEATAPAPAARRVQFDESGRVVSINAPEARWQSRPSQGRMYYTCQAVTLLDATEMLKKLSAIPRLTYYVVETPDGTLGRDVEGFYTEAPLKTRGLAVEFRRVGSEPVEFESLIGFGNALASWQFVAMLTMSGQYARLVQMMKCGRCGYESPVETKAGALSCECYCCGTTNRGVRSAIHVYMGNQNVEI